MERKDEELMLDYQSGDHQAMEILFHRYKIRMLNFCLRMLGNRADAEDATSDVFLVLTSKRYAFHPEAKFSTWAYTITRNNCISRLRKQKKWTSLWFKKEDGTTQEWAIEDDTDSPRDVLNKREASQQVQGAIKHLPADQREALVLREYERLSYEEITVVLDCSLENVKILIYRARERLRIELSSFLKGGAS